MLLGYRKIYYSSLFFLVVFAFRLPILYNSTVLAFAYLLVASQGKNFFIVTKYLRNKYFLLLCLCYLILALLSILYPVLHQTNDFSKFKALLSQFFSAFTVYLLICHYLNTTKCKDNTLLFFIEVVIIAFIIQSMIILAAFTLPSFQSFVEIFQSVSDAERADKYLGVRGLALAGGQFFPLSATFVLAQLLLGFWILIENKNGIITFFLALLIAFAGATAGRSSLIGSVFPLIAYCYVSIKSNVIESCIKFIISLFVIFLFFNLAPETIFEKIRVYSEFVFEFVYNYIYYGKFETVSTSHLQRMYWPLRLDEWFLGYGRFTNEDGSMFMHTDAGYMRNLLFFGAVGLFFVLLSLLLQVLIFLNSFNFYKSHNIVFVLFFVFISNILHYKGEIISHLVGYQSIVYLLIFASLAQVYFDNKKDCCE